METLSKKINPSIIITKLAVLWLQKHHPEKQYALIVKKGLAWLKRRMGEEGLKEEELGPVEVV